MKHIIKTLKLSKEIIGDYYCGSSEYMRLYAEDAVKDIDTAISLAEGHDDRLERISKKLDILLDKAAERKRNRKQRISDELRR